MIKTVKCGIAAAVVVAAGFAAFQSYGSYGTQDNSLLMQNVEALAQGPDGGDGDAGDGNSFPFPEKGGYAKFCTLYVYMKGNVRVSVSDSPNPQLEATGEYTLTKIEGLRELCVDYGRGCIATVCQEVPYQ